MAAMFVLAAGAQNKAIDALAEKYLDAEGFTVVKLDGEAIKNMSGMLAQSNGTVSMGGDTPSVNVKKLLESISSVTVIALERADAGFAAEVLGAVSAGKYSPMFSRNEDGAIIKIVNAEIKRGQLRGNQEIVVTVAKDDAVVLVRVIGKIDTELLAKLAAEGLK